MERGSGIKGLTNSHIRSFYHRCTVTGRTVYGEAAVQVIDGCSDDPSIQRMINRKTRVVARCSTGSIFFILDNRWRLRNSPVSDAVGVHLDHRFDSSRKRDRWKHGLKR